MSTRSAEQVLAQLPAASSPSSPGITIVLSASQDVAALRACLDTFAECWLDTRAELIVVTSGGLVLPALNDVMRRYPAVMHLEGPPNATATELRRLGLLHATRAVICFVDANAPERQSWATELCRSWRNWSAVGDSLHRPACSAAADARRPLVSVVMPVHNGGVSFHAALGAVALTDMPRATWELIVVDDASRDDTELVAAGVADKLVRLSACAHGPGYARNRGFEVTLGDYIAFVNADVMVRPDTLRRMSTVLQGSSDVGAVFGSYAAQAGAKSFVSQYRNLLQRYYHERNAGDATTFSSACGAIRSDVFEQAGGYDEWHFPRRQLEDLELGQRIRRLGHRIMLDAEIQATNLKRWTIHGMIKTEIFDRGVPWMRLVRSHVSPTRDSSRAPRVLKRANIALTWLGIAFGLYAWHAQAMAPLWVALACVASVVANNSGQLAYFFRERGFPFAVGSIAIDLLYYTVSGMGTVFGWVARQSFGEPRPDAVSEAYIEMSIKHWPPVPVRRLLDARVRGETETAAADGVAPRVHTERNTGRDLNPLDGGSSPTLGNAIS